MMLGELEQALMNVIGQQQGTLPAYEYPVPIENLQRYQQSKS